MTLRDRWIQFDHDQLSRLFSGGIEGASAPRRSPALAAAGSPVLRVRARMIRGMFFRYLLVGLANTAVGYGVILSLQMKLGLHPIAANASGYAVGLFMSYALNRRYTFRSRRSYRTSIPPFAAAVVVCYLINLAVLQFSITVLELPAAISQGLAICAYTLSFYLANRYLVFDERRI